MKKLYRFIFFLIGVAGLVVLGLEADITSTDWQDLFDEKLPLVLLGLLGLWLVIFLLHTSIYRLILGPEVKGITTLRMLKITVSGFALNSVTPAGLVGGEPYRIMELKRYCSTEHAATSTLTFTIFYVMGHVFMWLTGALLYLALGCPGDTGISILLLLAGVFLAYLSFVFLRTRDHGFILSTLQFFGKVPFLKKLIERLSPDQRKTLKAIDDGIRQFNREPKRFRQALLLEYLSRLLEGLEYFIILRYLGEPISLLGGLMVMSMASLIGNLFFIIPMQAGTREGGMLIALGWFGIDSSAGIRAGLLYRVRDLICILVGIFFILVEKKVKKSE